MNRTSKIRDLRNDLIDAGFDKETADKVAHHKIYVTEEMLDKAMDIPAKSFDYLMHLKELQIKYRKKKHVDEPTLKVMELAKVLRVNRTAVYSKLNGYLGWSARDKMRFQEAYGDNYQEVIKEATEMANARWEQRRKDKDLKEKVGKILGLAPTSVYERIAGWRRIPHEQMAMLKANLSQEDYEYLLKRMQDYKDREIKD